MTSISTLQSATQAGELHTDSQLTQNQHPISLHTIVLAAQALQSDTALVQGEHQDLENLSALFTQVVTEQLMPSLEQQSRTYKVQLALVTQLKKEIQVIDGQTQALEMTIAGEERLYTQQSQETANKIAHYNERACTARMRYYEANPPHHLKYQRLLLRNIEQIWRAVCNDLCKKSDAHQDTSFHREFDSTSRTQMNFYGDWLKQKNYLKIDERPL